ncbi:MAG TPA: KR domain-containing protein [Erythrobacter sp.]|jgi:NAD(P)-dependent dehydrogenase (short-subunit alcohol dehydrogenase family)|uniref:SDR family NAD(P)-dependent oxidoreductase n=1 Tax=Qipengyuania citrea TaxID=225971 RepID=UPI00067EC633|nr:SDR family NAD(P)-dependent oxidoreductase [Qipengyuania citrea]RZP19337.1 MAG: SDR family NAD(P)-dependent oxidoreductase [Erythrobacter sp.]HBQ92326.1 KR domain-containing protein [Erythrobacter sp.]HCC27654.1 KR domain-containing protein [Erythrobacter sp.]HCI63341.1 KR domain-containing protein [Erythrobacter sp.]HCJ20065.1 KR domain-containing protein [Erythrobacter sp.]|tara:strand:+ start:1137 stop:1847 length:711 start_codon:yes stop_codon:yes gene_type:complete
MTKPLDNRLALVTGASKGIGAATAQALAAAGAHVVLTGRDVRALEAVEDTIHAAGGASTIAPVDLAESDGIARLASAIASRWDKLDVLVAAAAYLPALTPVTQIDGKQLSQALTVNFLSTQALLANFDPLLKRAEAGRVIGLTSSVGANPRAYWAAYGTTKAAFDNLLESYAQEVEKTSKVRVALVDPGATRTAMRAKAYPGEDPQTVKPPETVAERLTQLLVEGFDGFHRERVEA